MESLVSLNKVYLFLGVFLAVSLLVILAIILDLWDGVHTARFTRQRVHSHKLRITVSKIGEYWRFILIGFLVDCLGVIFSFYFMPFVTVVFGAGLIAVEAKSMFEHAGKRKSHTRDLPDIIARIIGCVKAKDAEEIVKLISSNINSTES